MCYIKHHGLEGKAGKLDMRAMGYYINPQKGSKEQFLKEKGLPILGPEWPHDPKYGLVCLMNNGMFTAAGVCFSPREMEAFSYKDGRPKQWFLVKKQDLVNVKAIRMDEFRDD